MSELSKNDIEQIHDLANIQLNKQSLNINDIELYIKNEVRSIFHQKYPEAPFEEKWELFKAIPNFPALGNIYEIHPDGIDEETHFLMRTVATWYVSHALDALKFDLNGDPNLRVVLDEGNIGTAGRIVKIWAGNGLDSENIREYGAGRFTKEPRLAAFPVADHEKNKPVTVVVENPGVTSVCSHHFLPFSVTNDKNSKIVVSYIPKDKVLGLSKITRYVEWCLNRPSLQEEVTALIHNKIKDIAETDDVYVGLLNMVHTCETTRGSKQYSTTTTEFYTGIFEDHSIRNSIVGRSL